MNNARTRAIVSQSQRGPSAWANAPMRAKSKALEIIQTAGRAAGSESVMSGRRDRGGEARGVGASSPRAAGFPPILSRNPAAAQTATGAARSPHDPRPVRRGEPLDLLAVERVGLLRGPGEAEISAQARAAVQPSWRMR